MIIAESLYTFIAASTLLGLAPGPDNIFVLTQSALHGRKAGLLVTLGLCTGLIAHTSAVALGVAALLQASPTAFTLLKMAGALYLIYLAWLAFSASRAKLRGNADNKLTGIRLYRRGIIMNVTNPKVTIFFLAFLPQFVTADQGGVAQQIFLLGALFILVTLFVFGGIAFLAGALGAWLNDSPKAQVYLNWIAGTVYLGLAIKLATGDSSG